MTEYEHGFQDGEKQSFHDRRSGIRRQMTDPTNDYQRGYRDGYTPRSLTWLLSKPAAPWWQERESEMA